MATNTYTALRTTTVSTAVSSITLDLTGITGYTDLVLVDNTKVATVDTQLLLRFNGSSDPYYSTTFMFGTGSSAISSRASNDTAIYISRSNPTNGLGVTHIQNYSNSTTFKTVLSRGNSTDYVFAWCGLWRGNTGSSTAPITSLTISTPSGQNFLTGSTFTVYGIQRAPNVSSTTTPPVAGYSLWLDGADDSSFTYSSGALVSQWSDKSGNSRHFTQATTSSQPSRLVNIRQNNYPVVMFNSDLLANTGFNWGASNSTLFVVAKEDKTLGTGYQNLITTGTGATGEWGYGIADDASFDELGIFDIGQGFAPFGTSMTNGNADVLAFKTSGISSGSVTAYAYKNGTSVAIQPATRGSTTSAAGMVLGSNSALNESFYGYVCEVILYPSQLSDTDRNLVEAYLKEKWSTP
jgi:hypothetical protein